MSRVRVLAVALAAGLVAALPFTARAADPWKYERGAITSFDGTKIVYNLFLPNDAGAGHKVPLIMRTHGWGGSGETASDASKTLNKLVAADYAVLTWDSRGFGDSGGEANVDDPAIEGKDAQKLLDWAAARPEILLQAPGDPVVGMTGGSYAGGIQLALAAFDRRIDAIAPEITWNDLRYSLFPHGVPKLGWGELLYGAGLATAATDGLQGGPGGTQTGVYAAGIHQAEVDGTVNGTDGPGTQSFFAQKSLAVYGAKNPVRVPTLLMQGSVDTLFNLNDAWANFRAIAAQNVPVRLVAFCGGHVSCPSAYDDGHARDRLDTEILAWFARYLRHQPTAPVPAPVTYATQDGAWHDLSTFPTLEQPGPAHLLHAHGAGTLVSTGGVPPTSTGPNESIDPVVTDTPSPDGDPGTLTVPIAKASAPLPVVGIPRVLVHVSGAAQGVHLFFKLVDRQSGEVLDLQAESLRVDGLLTTSPQSFYIDLVGVTYLLPKGHDLDLQVSTSSAAHAGYRVPGAVTVDVAVAVPVL